MMTLSCDCGFNSEQLYPLPARRDFRTKMKRQTKRKLTAGQRIEMNRFWNELEEIFDRLDNIKVEKVDSYEEAENILNETLECDKEVESAFLNASNGYSCWCEKPDLTDDGDVSGYSSNYDDDDDDDDLDSNLSLTEDGDDSLLTSPCSYISFDYLPMPPSFDKTLINLKNFSLTEL